MSIRQDAIRRRLQRYQIDQRAGQAKEFLRNRNSTQSQTGSTGQGSALGQGEMRIQPVGEPNPSSPTGMSPGLQRNMPRIMAAIGRYKGDQARKFLRK